MSVMETVESMDEKVTEEQDDFTILPNIVDPNATNKKRKNLYRLPEWMSSLAKRFDSSTIENKNAISIDQLTYLDEDLQSILVQDFSIQHLFPVQSQVIPYLIEQYRSHSPLPSADICVSSPTGSGKTLTYVIPLVQCLRQRVTRGTRAVILLPVQDLAEQVFQVVDQLAKKFLLKTALLSGQQSFEDEQKVLVYQQLNGRKTLVDEFESDFKINLFQNGCHRLISLFARPVVLWNTSVEPMGSR